MLCKVGFFCLPPTLFVVTVLKQFKKNRDPKKRPPDPRQAGIAPAIQLYSWVSGSPFILGYTGVFSGFSITPWGLPGYLNLPGKSFLFQVHIF